MNEIKVCDIKTRNGDEYVVCEKVEMLDDMVKLHNVKLKYTLEEKTKLMYIQKPFEFLYEKINRLGPFKNSDDSYIFHTNVDCDYYRTIDTYITNAL